MSEVCRSVVVRRGQAWRVVVARVGIHLPARGWALDWRRRPRLEQRQAFTQGSQWTNAVRRVL